MTAENAEAIVIKVNNTLSKIVYPCGCMVYLERGCFPSVSICEKHHIAVFGVKYVK